MKPRTTGLLAAATGAIAAGATALAYTAYRKDIKAARQRLRIDRQVIQAPAGAIEFAESGDGPAVLLSHGAGGGFDQGLDLGRAFLGDKFRVIAPSRFGYLGTALPADASAEAQADAHVQVLDALQLGSVPVIGVSAGAPSAMQLCLNYPERCSALLLVVPAAFSPKRETGVTPPPRYVGTFLNTVGGSDFLFWTATKLGRLMLVKTILGTPVDVYRNASPDDRRAVDRMLDSVLPISRRVAGLGNDARVVSNLARYRLEDVNVPALVISTADDLYGTYEGSRYTAEYIHDAKLVLFQTGGHLLVGHEEEVRAQITSFLNECLEPTKRTAMAV